MFTKILIANRGEIACRIIQTVRRMGIASVAIYSEADRNARHVELADESICVGAAAAKDSYLNSAKIIDACRQTGAQAVHPGYGFLSENENFCSQLEAAGIVFIGPKADAIAAMGDKIAAKKIAQQAGVATIPGYTDVLVDAQQALTIAQKIGYPIMLKASAGGGGKGLRIAFNDNECLEGFEACQNEARNAFGDDRIFIEKFIQQPRHIEIQVVGDAHGNYIHLGERECSIQRRHQKLVEETPSPFLKDATRHAMAAQAIALARAVNYQSAGTVEFVVAADQAFYFLEMNTRLQVEHPVTELVTKLDLVELMIRIAAGEPLSIRQQDVQHTGWAIECRINAEDPYRNFLPSSGRLVKYSPPTQQAGVRVDTGVVEGGDIPIFYDSMIAKLVVHAQDRATCLEKMRTALDAFVIRGVQSNIPFQAALLAHPKFCGGQFNTGFIAEEYPIGFAAVSTNTHVISQLILAVAAGHAYLAWRDCATKPLPTLFFEVFDESQFHPVEVAGDFNDMQIQLATQSYTVKLDWTPGQILARMWVNQSVLWIQLERQAFRYKVYSQGVNLHASVLLPHVAELKRRMPKKEAADMHRQLRSPMPGLLSQIAVVAGQEVKAGEKLAVIEAMKMENLIRAPHDLTIARIAAKAGDTVAVDQLIMEFV